LSVLATTQRPSRLPWVLSQESFLSDLRVEVRQQRPARVHDELGFIAPEEILIRVREAGDVPHRRQRVVVVDAGTASRDGPSVPMNVECSLASPERRRSGSSLWTVASSRPRSSTRYLSSSV